MVGRILAGLIVVLAFVGVFAGCGSEGTSVAGEFSIVNLVFCSDEPGGYMSYKEQPQATYRPGDTIWVYMNLKNQKYNPNPDGTNEMWFTEVLTLKAPNGEVLAGGEVVNEHQNFTEDLDPGKVFLRNNINTTPQLAEGQYTVEIEVTDKLANKTATASSRFTLKE